MKMYQKLTLAVALLYVGLSPFDGMAGHKSPSASNTITSGQGVESPEGKACRESGGVYNPAAKVCTRRLKGIK